MSFALVKYNNNSISDITTAGTLSAGSMILVKEVTASSDANVSFVHGTSSVVFDSTYPLYRIDLINVHPADDRVDFTMNFTSDGTNYNVSKQTNVMECYNWENGSSPAFAYRDLDLANSTAEQSLAIGCGNDNDECIVSSILIFEPASTTFVKQFIIDTQFTEGQGLCFRQPIGGYCNTTSAITGVRFKVASGNIDSGTFKLYGIKDS